MWWVIIFYDFIKNSNFILIYEAISFYDFIKNYNFVISSELIECPSLLKCDEVVDFANKSQADKSVSKKAGSVKNFQCLNVSEFLKI